MDLEEHQTGTPHVKRSTIPSSTHIGVTTNPHIATREEKNMRELTSSGRGMFWRVEMDCRMGQWDG